MKSKQNYQPKTSWDSEQKFYRSRLAALQKAIEPMEVTNSKWDKVIYNYNNRAIDHTSKDSRAWLLSEIQIARKCLEDLYHLVEDESTKEQLAVTIRVNGNALFEVFD